MILLLEGLSCTGKSTLAAQFSEDLDWPILKFNVPPDNAYSHFKHELTTSAIWEHHFIIDRCHLSNRAYSGQLGGGVMTPGEWRAVDEWLCTHNTWLLLMVDDPFSVESRLQNRTGRDDGAHQLSRVDIANIQTQFVEAFQASTIPVKGQFNLYQFIDPYSGIVTDHYRSVLEQIQREANGAD